MKHLNNILPESGQKTTLKRKKTLIDSIGMIKMMTKKDIDELKAKIDSYHEPEINPWFLSIVMNKIKLGLEE